MPGKIGWRSAETTAAKFRRYGPPGNPNECWLWTRARVASGYGRFWDHELRRAIYAHRMAYELVHGAIPEGAMVLHRCDNPPCTNPAHLFLGTCMDNKHDSMAKGRHVYGPRQHSAKLHEDQIPDIRSALMCGLSQDKIAKRFGVSSSMIWKIKKGISWKHVR